MRPPRTLKPPVGVWFSCLTTTSVPSRCASSGQAWAGVGWIARPTNSWAPSSSPRSNISRPSHQRLAAGKGGGGCFVGRLLRQQHLVVRLARGDHREAVFKRGDTAIEQHWTLDRDHLLDRAVEVAGLYGANADAAIGLGKL